LLDLDKEIVLEVDQDACKWVLTLKLEDNKPIKKDLNLLVLKLLQTTITWMMRTWIQKCEELWK
jgi:hypothetical protein